MVWIGILLSALFCWTMLLYVRDSRRRSMMTPQAADPNITAGYAIMLCHKRARKMGRENMREDWSASRADLVRRWREDIGFVSYVQVHQISRWSVTYNLVRASRSWPVVAVTSILQGLPVPRPTAFDRETREERWDVIEQFEFADRASSLAFLADERAAAARAALTQDTLGVMRRSHAIFMRTSKAYSHAESALPRCYTLFALRSRPYLGAPEAMRYWLTHHRPFVVKQQPVLQYCAYYQHVAERGPDLDAAVAGLSHSEGASWDAVASLQHQTFAELARGVVDPRVLVANARLVTDETRFLETQRSALLIGTPLARIAGAGRSGRPRSAVSHHGGSLMEAQPDRNATLNWGVKRRFQRIFLRQAARSYVFLSFGMGIIALGLPVALLIAGGYDGNYSISWFYHLNETSRNILVGCLWATGVFLFLFHGLSSLENWILNIAGVAAISVAMNPMGEQQCGDVNGPAIDLHFASAIVFFVCLAIVAVGLSKGRVRYIVYPPLRQRYMAAYNVAGLAMIAMPAAVTAIQFLTRRGCESHWIFWIEAFGIWAFSFFWFVKTLEYRLLLGIR